MIAGRDFRLLVTAMAAGLGLAALARAERQRQPDTIARPSRAATAPSQRSDDRAGDDRAGNAWAGSDRPGNDRGRNAVSPEAIPPRGWWDILKRVYAKVGDDRALAEAAGVTFYALLAIFPALAALVSLYGLFADPGTIGNDLDALSGVVPEGGMQIIGDQVHNLSSHGTTALGFGVLFGLALSLWSANSGVKAMIDALNVVYEEREKRGYVRRTMLSFAFTAGGLIFLLIAMAAVIVLPAALAVIGLRDTTEWVLRIARWPFLLLVVTVFLAFLYRYGPSRTHAQWRWVSAGGAFASVVWIVGSAAFSFYVANFGSYDKTYGSLGAVIGFMTWLWISTIIVLVGAELNAEMEHQTAHDTTVGAPKPLGLRGARKADTVAA